MDCIKGCDTRLEDDPSYSCPNFIYKRGLIVARPQTLQKVCKCCNKNYTIKEYMVDYGVCPNCLPIIFKEFLNTKNDNLTIPEFREKVKEIATEKN